MINYLLKSGILLFIFFTVYKLWLENERMFLFNRFYLLTSLIFSLLIPLQLFSIDFGFDNKIDIVQLNEIIIKNDNKVLNKTTPDQILFSILGAIYLLIVLLLTIRFALNLFSFYRKSKENEMQFINGEKVILMNQIILPHSFWNAIFINKEEFENGKIPSELIVHEKAHLDQKHTLDILFVETLQIVFWFNPLIVLYKKAIKLNHEFLADEAVNNQFKSVTDYQNLLLGISSNKSIFALASNINYLITKKRFIMMTKKKSPLKIILKSIIVSAIYVLVLFTFTASSVAQDFPQNNKNETSLKITDLDKKPEFPGGMEKFYMFMGQNFKISEALSKHKMEGKLNMEFIIEKDGSLSEFKIINDLGYGAGDEAIRVLKLSPKWIPGFKNENPVRVMYSLPITIQTSN